MNSKDIILQVGVKILLRSSEGKYLLLHRAAEKYADIKRGLWDIVGGRIDPGTSLMENLQREVYEETGLTIMGTPQLVAAQDIMNDERHVVRLTYVGEAGSGNVTLDGTEHDSLKWLTRDELKAIDDMDEYFMEVLKEVEQYI